MIASWKRQDEEEDDLSTRSGYISEGDCEKIQASGPRDLRSRERQAEGIERAKALGQDCQWYFRMRKKEELG